MSRAKPAPPTFEAAQQQLTKLGFQLSPLREGHVLARKSGYAAVLAPSADKKTAEIIAPPGLVVGGELARLVDRGYQKFFKTADAEVPARPEEMSGLAAFENELRFGCGIPTLYNEGLGSVSDRYLYDRIWYRDQGQQPRPWEEDAARALRG